MAAAIRRPVVSGRFYPSDPGALTATVDAAVGGVNAEARPARAGVAPHAGYDYSGQTAAHLFARVAFPPLVAILAPNHTGRCGVPGGASMWSEGAFRTPLGDVPIAEEFGAELMRCSSSVAHDPQAHLQEHAVEVLLPFLQYIRPDVKIVPVVLAWDDWEPCRDLAGTLARLLRAWPESVFLLASSDLNHYEPASVGEAKDAEALRAVEALDGERLLNACRGQRISMCGRAPTAVVLEAARQLGSTHAEVVDYRHSGWVTGDDSAVVGYAAVVIQ